MIILINWTISQEFTEGVNPNVTKSLGLRSGGGQQMTWRYQVWLGVLGAQPSGMSTEMGILLETRVLNQN